MLSPKEVFLTILFALLYALWFVFLPFISETIIGVSAYIVIIILLVIAGILFIVATTRWLLSEPRLSSVIFLTAIFIAASVTTTVILVQLSSIEIVYAPPFAPTPALHLTPIVISPTNTPEPTPIALLTTVSITTEVQANGKIKNTTALSLNSLGMGKLLLEHPQSMNIHDSEVIKLSITPYTTLIQLGSITTSTYSIALKPPLRFTDDIEIYPIMGAVLSGAGFDITANGESEKLIVSDRPTEWSWTIKPKSEGRNQLVVEIFVPVKIKGTEKILSTSLKNISADITVNKSILDRINELIPVLIPALLGLVGVIIGLYAKKQADERKERLLELEDQLAKSAEERKILNQEIAKLKSIPKWQFWPSEIESEIEKPKANKRKKKDY